MRCTTQENTSPKGKPRVYFTCHPEDFNRYFLPTCEALFRARDCAVYNTWDLSSPIPQEELATDIGSNHLLVVPVTSRLLSQPNRAMDEDIPYALQARIPVLPIIMETGLDSIYSRPDKFGELQYLSPISKDDTQIKYIEKLKKYLESVFFDDTQLKQIREAFSAYIFLSYRKKDRRYANELMRLIHSNPRYRDIAIWYDEFLSPGASYQESITKALEDSRLFALVVTPSLLEEPEGKPNYVMSTEYPTAQRLGKPILPVEMKYTDEAALTEKYPGIPERLDYFNDAQFQKRLFDALDQIAVTENNDPMHLYLVGLAYLMGIDVEVDRARGMELIKKAAKLGLPDAMDKLFTVFNGSKGVQPDYQEAAYWAEQLVDYFQKNHGPEDPRTLSCMNNLSAAYGNLGKHQESLLLQEQVYSLTGKLMGEEDPQTLIARNNLAVAYSEQGRYQDALPLYEKSCSILRNIHGEENEQTLAVKMNLAYTYGMLKRYEEAIKLSEKTYTQSCKILGLTHPNTLKLLNHMSIIYYDSGREKDGIALQERVYALRQQALGERHPDTLTSMNNLAVYYGWDGKLKKALELAKKNHTLQTQILGENHPDTLSALQNVAGLYEEMDRRQKAVNLREKLWKQQEKLLGEAHRDTMKNMDALGTLYGSMGRHKEAIEIKEKLYRLRYEHLGKEHPDTVESLRSLSVVHFNRGDYKQALTFAEQYYEALCCTCGPKHQDAVQAKEDMERIRTYL